MGDVHDCHTGSLSSHHSRWGVCADGEPRMVEAITVPSRVGGMIERVRRSWAEVEYAQRRMFELRTGIVVPATRRRTHIEELEALYALEARAKPGRVDP